MKKYSVYKTIQLVILIAVAAGVLLWVLPNARAYHALANEPGSRLLAGALWVTLLVSFVFIFLDFTYFLNYRKEYREMELAASSDPVSGIANRFSCDILIEKYANKPLPERMSVMVLTLTNIQDINRLYGRMQGNLTIRDFSNILRISSADLCFVGRNGGNQFLAIFEEGTDDALALFRDRIEKRVNAHNRALDTTPIEYICAEARRSEAESDSLTSLIVLANSRASAAVKSR